MTHSSPEEPATAQAPTPQAADVRETPATLPSWLLGPGHVALAVLWGIFFIVLSSQRLPGGALWEDVVYGDWILEHRSLPVEDPFVPLAAGMKVLDATWLSQVLLASVERAGGLEGLSHLYALVTLATCLLLARACYLRSASKWASTLGVAAVLVIGGSLTSTLRAESFAALCFALLLWLVAAAGPGEGFAGPGPTAPARPWRLWLGVPLLFVLWANLHPSFVYGVVFLACCALGRAIDVGWRDRSLRRALEDGRARRFLYLAELAIAAALINPYGIDLLLDVAGFWVAGSPRARAGLELAIRGGPGLMLLLSWGVLAILLAKRRRWPWAELLPLAAFAALAAGGGPQQAWYAPIFALGLMPLLAGGTLGGARDAAAGARPIDPAHVGDLRYDPRYGCLGPSALATMVTVVVVFAAFTFSPFGNNVFYGRSRTSNQLLGPATPLAVTGYLRANPPAGQLFHPRSWGGWLVYEGPPGLQLFMTSQAGAVPTHVAQDFQRVVQAGYEWERIFSRYRVETVILEPTAQRLLVSVLRFASGWRMAYGDGQAVVFVRSSAESSENPEEAEAAAVLLGAEAAGNPDDEEYEP